MEDRFFASQAATLHTTYHLVQIIIYRPFIRVPRPSSFHRPMSAQRSMFSQKALAICLNSARAGAYICSQCAGPAQHKRRARLVRLRRGLARAPRGLIRQACTQRSQETARCKWTLAARLSRNRPGIQSAANPACRPQQNGRIVTRQHASSDQGETHEEDARLTLIFRAPETRSRRVPTRKQTH